MARLVGTFSFLVLGLLVVLLLSSSFLISSDLPRETVVEKYRNDASFFFTLPSGATAHIRDEGNRDGPAMFLLHGSNASLHSWELGWRNWRHLPHDKFRPARPRVNRPSAG